MARSAIIASDSNSPWSNSYIRGNSDCVAINIRNAYHVASRFGSRIAFDGKTMHIGSENSGYFIESIIKLAEDAAKERLDVQALVCYVEPGTTFFPVDGCNFRFRKLCIAGDTHHLRAPVRFLRNVSLINNFDEILFYCTPHHARFLPNSLDVPCYLYPHINPYAFTLSGDVGVAGEAIFYTFGSIDSPSHPRRRGLVNLLYRELGHYLYEHVSSLPYTT